MNHIATAKPSASGMDYSLLIMEAAMAVKMAVKMAVGTAPGAIPRPGRVPEQRVLSPEIDFRDGGGTGWVFVSWFFLLMFLGHDGLYRRRIGVGGATGCPDHRGAPPPWPRRGVVWWPCPPSLAVLVCSGWFREK